MNQRERMFAGIGGVAFTALTVAAMIFAKTPGGTYSASDIADYVAKGHQKGVITGFGLALLSVLGLILLLAGLRERVGQGSLLANVFSTTSLVSIAAFAIGWAAWLGPPLAIAIGGSRSVIIDPTVTYVVLQIGGVIIFGVAGTFLGLTLITLMIGSAQTLPSWLRWFTLIIGILALGSMAWLPFFPLFLWGLVIGIWLLVSSGKGDSPRPKPRNYRRNEGRGRIRAGAPVREPPRATPPGARSAPADSSLAAAGPGRGPCAGRWRA